MATNIFKKVAKKNKKKKTSNKSSVPEFEIDDDELKKAHDNWLKGKADSKDAKARISRSEGLLLPIAVEEHQKFCQANEKYVSSVKIVKKEEDSEEKITCSFTNRYSPIDSDHEDHLREIYGDNDFERYFKERTTVSLTPAAVNDEEFVEKITEFVGQENFDKFFKINIFIEPTKEYHEARMVDPNLAKRHKQAADADLVRCNKPSLKQG